MKTQFDHIVAEPESANSNLDKSSHFLSQAKYLKILLKNTQSNVICMDKDGYLVACSDAFLRLIGVENYDLIKNRHFREMFGLFENDSFFERAERHFQEIKATGEPMETNFRIDFSGWGEKRLYALQITPFIDDGVFEGAYVLFKDMSEWVNLKTEERAQAMLESMPFACNFWDQDFNLIEFNQKAVSLYECESKQECAEMFFDMSPKYQPDGTLSIEKAMRNLNEAYETGQKTFMWEHITKKGNKLPAEIHLQRIKWDENDRIIAYIFDMRDMQAKDRLLQEADERTSLLLDATPFACCIWDGDGNILDCNHESLYLFGFDDKVETLSREDFLKLIPQYQPDGKLSVALMDEATEQALKYGHARFEWICHTKTGEALPLSTTLVRTPWKGGIRILAYSSDMRQLKTIENEAEERMRIMLNAMPQACTLRDENNVIIDCNQEALLMFGTSRKSDILERFDDFHPDFQPDGQPSREKARAMIGIARKNGSHRFEWMYRTATGEELPAEVTLVLIAWRENQYRLASYARDLRESRAINLKITEANNRVRTMLDAVPMACVFLDERYEAIDCNAAAPQLFGAADKDEFLRHYGDFMPMYQPDGTHSLTAKSKHIQDAFKTGASRFEWMHRTASGDDLPASVILIRVKWNDQYCIAAYIIDMREIRAYEQKRLEADRHSRELEIQALAAKAASETKSKFLAAMSHEIRTPMNAIIGMSDLISTDNLDQTQLGYIGDIRKMSKALLEIINDILDFSKVEAGKMDLIPVHFDLREMCDNLCSMCRFMAESKDLGFKYSFGGGVPRAIYGDETRIRQVTLNLLNNAVKYTKEGYVEFGVKAVEKNGRRFTAFIIKDTGVGIKQENIPKLYDAFAQFDRNVHRGVTGTGLGLPITKNLVEMMGGEIELESAYGQGSTFTALLPLLEGDLAQIEKASVNKFSIADEGVKVLVVDDNNINIRVATAYLAKHNIKADSATSGAKAIQMIQEKNYDLVFMDHMMPEMDGIETTTHVRALPDGRGKEIPVIALSANVVTGARELFLGAGMNDFLTKPIDPQALNSTLLKWLPGKMRTEGAHCGETEDASEYDALIRDLSDIEGLDVQKGITGVGGKTSAYVSILRQVCSEAGCYVGEIKKFLSEENWKEYSIRVHAMKGAFANIGAEGISKQAYGLELASKGGDYGKCADETDDICDKMVIFRDALLRTTLMDEAEEEKTSASASLMAQKLEELKVACLDGKSGEAEDIASELAKAGFDKHAEDLLHETRLLVKSYDYEEAISLAGTLLDYLLAHDGENKIQTLSQAAS
ncbi:MAG: PAS domain-containing protein [Synergistaceae bacterium]|jgi:PAS domain S-box-containing protein|nr:PAS domain-containing protein [Synergistaceae bacterium]